MLKLLNLKTSYLNKNIINDILKLKDTHWKKGLTSQKKYFNKNINKNDHHILMYYKNIFVGYVLLRNKKCKFKRKSTQYYHFDTFIVKKNFRKLKLSNFLMDFIKNFISFKKSLSILFCEVKVVKYYQKFGWKKIDDKKVVLNLDKPKYKKILYFK
jgi:hypothetical protein